MLKREIKYEDFNGEQVSEIFYFNISKPEIIELEVKYKQGFGRMLQDIVDAKDNFELVQKFKDIVLMAYGEKSPDGKRFVKNEQLKEEFSQTAAYQALFMELAEDANKASAFMIGIMPKDLGEKIDQDKPTAPPALKEVPPPSNPSS